jgi:hypothetical protein
MKTFIKTFACALAASLLLLACSDAADLTGDNSTTDGVKKASQYDPPLLIIANDVQVWIEKEALSKSNEKRLVNISDMYLSADYCEDMGLSATISDGKVEYFLNGKKISAEEYQSRYEVARESINLYKRDLAIPGEIVSTSSRSWTVLITAGELAEVTKSYDKLAIDFFVEVQELPWIEPIEPYQELPAP